MGDISSLKSVGGGRVRNAGLPLRTGSTYLPAATSLADVPREPSPALGAPESNRSRAPPAHAGLAIRQPPCCFTRDIVANRQQ